MFHKREITLEYLLDIADPELERNDVLDHCTLAERLAAYSIHEGYYSDPALRIPCYESLTRELGPHEPETLRSLEQLGSSYRVICQFDKATELLQRCFLAQEDHKWIGSP